MPWKHVVVAGFIRVVFLLTCLSVVPAHAQDHLFGVDQRLDDVPGLLRVSASALDIDQLQQWNQRIGLMLDTGELRTVRVTEDTLIPGRAHERLQQHYENVPVYGATVTRQGANGQAVSIFGEILSGIELDARPALSATDAKALIEGLAGTALDPDRLPKLLVYPKAEGGYALVYREQVMTGADLIEYFIDAHSGALVAQFSILQRQQAVGSGLGVHGKMKKVSVTRTGGGYYADDALRPPSLTTLDMFGNPFTLTDIVNGIRPIRQSDSAFDANNQWDDANAVDAHVHTGLTYDYLYKQFGHQGLDNLNSPVRTVIHPIRRDELSNYIGTDFEILFINAYYVHPGLLVLGEGLPPEFTLGGQRVEYFAAALDIVAHEFGHGVTAFSSNLIYRNESGALNEAYSDILGTGAEFFFEPVGDGLGLADYQIGEDVFRPGGMRSLSNPGQFGDPDHYSLRRLGTDDYGFVHSNSTIAGHAFYLAIEGGENRTSGLSVQGVGAVNRAQIEKIFYRAFTLMLTPNASFIDARSTTIQSARDLYEAGSAAERAVTEAWDAVGVVPQGRTRTTFSPDPVPASSTNACGGDLPAWHYTIKVSEIGGAGITIHSASFRRYGPSGELRSEVASTAMEGRRIPAFGSAQASRCATLDTPGGFVRYVWFGTDDGGREFAYQSSKLQLLPTNSLTQTGTSARPVELETGGGGR
jgi:thermolysin